jgi:predicted RNA-binding Zn ribbon-like protein
MAIDGGYVGPVDLTCQVCYTGYWMREGYELLAGRPCLDFANTMGGDALHAPREYLESYDDLVTFARMAGLVPEARAKALLARAKREPEKAAAALENARLLRGTIFRVFYALTHDRRPASDDLARINDALAHALARRRVVQRGAAFELGWDEEGEPFDRPLWPIVVSAAELLADGDRPPVRICCSSQERRCTWMFVDESRNRTRRWCSMKDCGNRAKARRHYERVHKG